MFSYTYTELYNIKMDLREIAWDGRAGSNWLRIGTSGGLL
jgi:hypothetical protein